MAKQYFRVFWDWYVDTLSIHIRTFKVGSKLNLLLGSPANLRLEVLWMFKAECLLYVFWMFTCRLGCFILLIGLNIMLNLQLPIMFGNTVHVFVHSTLPTWTDWNNETIGKCCIYVDFKGLWPICMPIYEGRPVLLYELIF